VAVVATAADPVAVAVVVRAVATAVQPTLCAPALVASNNLSETPYVYQRHAQKLRDG